MARKDKKKKKDAVAVAGDRITRDDIEKRLRRLSGEVEQQARSALPVVVAVGAAAAVGVVAVAYFMGRRRGRKRSTIVEVRRLG